MILVDTSVWIDHFRSSDELLSVKLAAGRVLLHPFVIGEIAVGFLRNRATVLHMLGALPQTVMARDGEVLRLIEMESLSGLGIGYVDAHLLAAVRLTVGTKLWTRDKRLGTVAARLNLAAGSPLH